MGWFQGLKQIVPPSLWGISRSGWYWVNRTTQWPSATFHPWRRASVHRLAAYKDLHHGKRCFIIGNGPSLRELDLSKLRHEFTFGMNRIYLLFPELGFNSTYFVSINDLVIQSDERQNLWKALRERSPASLTQQDALPDVDVDDALLALLLGIKNNPG